MNDHLQLADQFHRLRGHLRGVASRILGSSDEADDAIQEAWLRASRSDVSVVANVPGWLTTIVGRVCLDMIRARRRRPEVPVDVGGPGSPAGDTAKSDPAEAAELADSIGLALLVVLNRLTPAERVAFVLHDLFAVPFDEIAEVVERSPDATKKLASRARQRVRGAPRLPASEVERHRRVVEAFLAATRAGDLYGLIAVLSPGVERRADRVALGRRARAEVRGAGEVAGETLTNGGRARFAEPALIEGEVGAVVAPRGRLRFVLQFVIHDDRIAAIEVLGDPLRLQQLDIALCGPVTSA
ncbi:sigma-70 family RNA polymerase sigma factor [Dactylosporangium roseum]|uniref:Sigma-70 family RNA polymerase sigma factor n=1 Tax=Dactylosporangium roseum TaxID=47989 RepID=A0ABY5ZFC1_9ACTN|nr:sigma-70 family RNA polymerase sigma factor [Dactylosporangium roseum]UWZ39447.1 sigma-70 family RNA polymerase sigma factor [Dactylosporangium roseum]